MYTSGKYIHKFVYFFSILFFKDCRVTLQPASVIPKCRKNLCVKKEKNIEIPCQTERPNDHEHAFAAPVITGMSSLLEMAVGLRQGSVCVLVCFCLYWRAELTVLFVSLGYCRCFTFVFVGCCFSIYAPW